MSRMGRAEGFAGNAQPDHSPEANALLPPPSEVAELRAAYEQLAKDFTQFREHLPEAFVEVRLPDLRVSFLNQVALSVLGYTHEDVAAGIAAFALLDEASLVQVLD